MPQYILLGIRLLIETCARFNFIKQKHPDLSRTRNRPVSFVLVADLMDLGYTVNLKKDLDTEPAVVRNRVVHLDVEDRSEE